MNCPFCKHQLQEIDIYKVLQELDCKSCNNFYVLFFYCQIYTAKFKSRKYQISMYFQAKTTYIDALPLSEQIFFIESIIFIDLNTDLAHQIENLLLLS